MIKFLVLVLVLSFSQIIAAQERTIATFQVVGVLIDGVELPHSSPLAIDYKFTIYNGNLYFADGFEKGLITSMDYELMDNGIQMYTFIWESGDSGILGSIFLKNQHGQMKYYINVEHIGVEKPGNDLIFLVEMKEYSALKATLDSYLNKKTNKIRLNYTHTQIGYVNTGKWSNWKKNRTRVIMNANENNDIYEYSTTGTIARYRPIESWTRGYNENIGAYSVIRVERTMEGVRRTAMVYVYDEPERHFVVIYEDTSFAVHYAYLEE